MTSQEITVALDGTFLGGMTLDVMDSVIYQAIKIDELSRPRL